MATSRTRPAEAAVPEARDRIAAAARDLFASDGYDRTTVDAIAERAGVARRTFFRHFRSKDDVIFPDHDRLAVVVQAHLEALGSVPPVRAVCSAARLVFLSYVDDPAVSVQRYRLAASVPALRDREIASVSQYTRIFSRYLRGRLGEGAGARLRGDVVAASVVAAHNAVLREWLRSGGAGDPRGDLDLAFGWVVETFEGTGAQPPGGADEGVIVAVFRSGSPLDDVVERISRSL